MFPSRSTAANELGSGRRGIFDVVEDGLERPLTIRRQRATASARIVA